MNMERGTLWRVIAIACAAAVLMATVAACGSSGSSSAAGGGGQPVEVAHFLSTLTNTYNKADEEGGEAAAKKLGNVKVQAFASEFDPNKQIQQIETAAASGQYDAFVIAPLDGVRVIPAIEQAAAKGIVVACEFSVCGDTQNEFANELKGVTVQTGINAGLMAEQTAPSVNAACKGKSPCNVVIMYGLPQLVAEKWWGESLEANLEPNVKVVATGEGEFLAETSYKNFKDILQANPDIDVVVSSGDQMIVGVQQAIDEAGMEGKVALIGTGASESSVGEIEAHKWYGSHVLRPYHDGYVSTELAVRAARGEKVPSLVDTLKTPVIPGGMVTQENAGKWNPEWAG
jgi:ribose transport system substrate-binding protein